MEDPSTEFKGTIRSDGKTLSTFPSLSIGAQGTDQRSTAQYKEGDLWADVDQEMVPDVIAFLLSFTSYHILVQFLYVSSGQSPRGKAWILD